MYVCVYFSLTHTLFACVCVFCVILDLNLCPRRVLCLAADTLPVQLTQQYSGGNKRKLSLAVSYMGAPRVVFLGAPAAGTGGAPA